jgi:hypothetical protein
VKIWNLETSEEVCVLMGHKAKVTALHFSEGGRFVFSGDASGLLLVRSCRTRHRVLSARGVAPVPRFLGSVCCHVLFFFGWG